MPWTMHLLLAICFFPLYKFSVILKRIFHHPLSRFPGPKLAAATSLYRTYYEVGGEFLEQINKMHEQYGAVVRIGPNELHFNDPRAYNDIYSSRHRYPKEPTFYRCFGVDHSTFGTIDPHESKRRRDVLGPMFSPRTVLELEPTIQTYVDTLIQKLAFNNGPSDMFFAFRCTTLDIITSHCFGKDIGALESKYFTHPLLTAIQATATFFWLIKAYPWIFWLLLRCPIVITSYLHHHIRSFLAIRQQVDELVTVAARNSTVTEQCEQMPIVCRQLLCKRQISTSLFTRQSILDEALSLLHAGSDTVGNTCTVGTFYILNDPTVCKKLIQELASVWPDSKPRVPLHVLQRLPYLTAVIKESLRLSHGFVSPLPRIVDTPGSQIAGFMIPPGTVVGMSVTALHSNATIFPDPNTFSPKRWLQSDSRKLERFLAPFSRGPRMCIGRNLAWAELYLIFGNIFRRLEMEIYHTSPEDFDKFKDYFIPVHQGRHLQVTVTGHQATYEDIKATFSSIRLGPAEQGSDHTAYL